MSSSRFLLKFVVDSGVFVRWTCVAMVKMRIFSTESAELICAFLCMRHETDAAARAASGARNVN